MSGRGSPDGPVEVLEALRRRREQLADLETSLDGARTAAAAARDAATAAAAELAAREADLAQLTLHADPSPPATALHVATDAVERARAAALHAAAAERSAAAFLEHGTALAGACHLLPLSQEERGLQLQAALAEYESLRLESLTSITNRTTIANFTFGALAVILAGLLARGRPTPLIGWVAVLFVPQVSKTGLLIWLGEYERSQRAGKWIADLEVWINCWLLQGTSVPVSPARSRPAVNGSWSVRAWVAMRTSARRSRGWVRDGMGTKIPSDPIGERVTINRPLGWESKLISNSEHMGYPYLSTALLLLGSGWASVMIGLGILYPIYSGSEMAKLGVAVVFVCAVTVESWFALFFRAKWIAIRRDYAIPVGTGDLRRSV